ncbi:cell division cycle-associated protein 7 [Austrofundulus limnaeus]|uniref:Cell division cycle-associated protein 7 n=1 Tax=Austrofundulus limnaeus TaxID=52670 RepID=A0A2I4AVT7_AUSLI|nr:PREDICTED: cell division cycle-associated protein 7-like [Austrofundulus limnaeus]
MAESVTGMSSDMKKLAEVFAEDSENDATFYGFSDTELIDTNSDVDYEACPDISPKKEPEVKSIKAFRQRIALVSAPSLSQSSYEEEEEEDKLTADRGVQRPRKDKIIKKERHGVKSEDEETEVTEGLASDVNEDVSDHFLVKREQNIKANKAMLAQLMADLQKMPGGAGFLKKQAGKPKTKGRSSRPPQSGLTGRESKKNTERTSRRLTRSMKSEEASPPKGEDVELSLEEELLEVRRAPRRRGTSRPKQSKPHLIRPVEDITEDELQLVADNMTDKVYNTVTGSTCHQCRQKTVDTKTCCRSDDCRGIQGQFCGPCLRNRYGEDVKKALLDPNWKCPPCRGICNCSFCRQRDGRCPTGILFPLAQYCGFSDVHSYLTSLRDKLKGEEKVEM